MPGCRAFRKEVDNYWGYFYEKQYIETRPVVNVGPDPDPDGTEWKELRCDCSRGQRIQATGGGCLLKTRNHVRVAAGNRGRARTLHI